MLLPSLSHLGRCFSAMAAAEGSLAASMARENGCPLGFESAAAWNRLDILVWLRDNGCPLNAKATTVV